MQGLKLLPHCRESSVKAPYFIGNLLLGHNVVSYLYRRMRCQIGMPYSNTARNAYTM
jgi:hypothetical protein